MDKKLLICSVVGIITLYFLYANIKPNPPVRLIDTVQNVASTTPFGMAIKSSRDGKYIDDYGEYELIRDSLATSSPTTYHNKKYGFSITSPCYLCLILDRNETVGNLDIGHSPIIETKQGFVAGVNISLDYVTKKADGTYDFVQKDKIFYEKLGTSYKELGVEKIEFHGKDTYLFRDKEDVLSGYLGKPITDTYVILLGENVYLFVTKIFGFGNDKNIIDDVSVDKIISTITFDK